MDSDDDGYSSTSESEFPLSLPVLTPALASSSSATPAHALAPKPAKGKGKQSAGPKGDKDSGGDKEPRKRSSKACTLRFARASSPARLAQGGAPRGPPSTQISPE